MINRFRVLFVLFIFISNYFYYLPGLQSAGKEEEVFFVAKKAFEDGYYEASLGLFNRFKEEFPGSLMLGEAELLSGEALFYQNKLNDALAVFEKLLNSRYALNIKDAAIYWIAEVYFKKNDFTKSAQNYKKLISLFPNSSYAPLAIYSLGWSLFEEGKFKEALEYFRAMEEKYPNEPQSLDASFKSLECLYALKEYGLLKEKAGQLVKPLLKDNARLAYLYFYLAEAEYYLGDFNRALEFFTKATKESSDSKLHSLAHLGAGWAYLKLNEYKKSGMEFSLVGNEGLNKKNLEALALGRGGVLLKQGRPKEAGELFEKVLGLTEDQSVREAALVQIADINYDLGSYLKAAEYYNLALKDFPNGYYRDYALYRNSVASYALGLEYFQKGDYEASLKALQEYGRKFKNSLFLPEVSYLLGSCYYNIGDFIKAIENFKDVLSRSQDTQLIQKAEFGIADSYYNLGDEKEAVFRFNSLRSKHSGSEFAAKALFWLAGYYYQHNELDIAARYFLSLIQDYPESGLAAEAYYSLGIIFSSQGMYKEAVVNFRKAADSGRPEVKFISIFALAEAFESSGDDEVAIKEYLKASADDEFKERAFLRIARIYEDRENFKEAVIFYTKAIETGGQSSAYARERISLIGPVIKK